MSSVPSPESTRRPRRQSAPPSVNGANGDRPDHPAPSAHGANGGPAGPGAPSTHGANGRDAHGRFIKGNPGGPGNPFARRVAAFRRAVCTTVTEADVQAVARKLLQEALRGDVAAIRVRFAYVVGRPVEVVDPDTVDLQEWRMYRDHVARAEDLTGLFATVPPELAVLLARAVLPHIGDAFRRNFVKEAGLETLPIPDEPDDDSTL